MCIFLKHLLPAFSNNDCVGGVQRNVGQPPPLLSHFHERKEGGGYGVQYLQAMCACKKTALADDPVRLLILS